MKASPLATIPIIFSLASSFTVDCLPRSFQSPKNWLSKRSPTQSGSICQLNRLGPTKRTSSGSRNIDEDDHHDCSKSIDSVTRYDRSDDLSASDHFPKSKLSSKSIHSSWHRYSKEHPYNWEKKHHPSHSTFRPAASYSPLKNAPSAASAGSVANNTEDRVNQDEAGQNDAASAANDAASELNNFLGSFRNHWGAYKFNPWGGVHNPWGAVNNPWNPEDAAKDPPNGKYQGKATYFYQEGNPGACGKVHADSDYVVAIQSEMYGSGKFCGKTVLVTRKSTGQTIKCIAADECPGCPTHQSLDLSVGAFSALASLEEGVFDIDWAVVD